MYGIPRGIANNNPGNLRRSGSPWIGKLVPSGDKDFEQFDTPIDGLRALAKLLLNYAKVLKVTSVRSIIGRFAPSSENDTDSYASEVSKALGVLPDSHIVISDRLAELMKAIIEHENGQQPYTDDQIEEAIGLA